MTGKASTFAGRAGAWLGAHIAPPRFVLFTLAALTALVYFHVATPIRWPVSALLAFDIASALFLLSLLPLLKDSTAEEIRAHAIANDTNRVLVLILTMIVAMVVMSAVYLEISGDKSHFDWPILLVVVSLALSWLFSNSVYAIHYAHLYYSKEAGGDRRGLDFPTDLNKDGDIDDDKKGIAPDFPNYWDFIYFSFTLGMTFQTSDTAVTNTQMRQVVTMQSLVAFIFNIGVIAFTINVLGSSK